MTQWHGTLGELISAIYEESIGELGDPQSAALVTEQIIHELLDAEAPCAMPLAA